MFIIEREGNNWWGKFCVVEIVEWESGVKFEGDWCATGIGVEKINAEIGRYWGEIRFVDIGDSVGMWSE